MPWTLKGRKIMVNLEKQYGSKKAKNVMFGGITKGKFTGVEPAKSEKKLRARYTGGKKKKK